MDDLTEVRRAAPYVDYCERVRLREVWAEQQSISKALRRSFHCKLRRCVKGGIGSHRHDTASPFASLKWRVWLRKKYRLIQTKVFRLLTKYKARNRSACSQCTDNSINADGRHHPRRAV